MDCEFKEVFLLQKTSVFTQQAKVILTDEDLASVQIALVRDPYRGALIIGGGGLRKLRVGLANKGKRGGARVITCVVALNESVTLLSIYDKAERANISDEELKQMLKAADLL